MKWEWGSGWWGVGIELVGSGDWGGGEWGSGWRVESFCAVSVILRTLVYLIVWSTLHKVPWFLFLCVYMMFRGLPSTFTLLLKNVFCFTLCYQSRFNNLLFAIFLEKR